MRLLLFFLIGLFVLAMSQAMRQKSMRKPIYELTAEGKGKKVGSVEVMKRDEGIAIHVVASGLQPGKYGFHMHENNSMTTTPGADGRPVIGGGFGGHWDPDRTHTHAGPQGKGHRGDLEMLVVDEKGNLDQTVFSKRIPFEAIKGKAFVIHAMPDNYTDRPVNGGSGARMYAAPF